MSKAQAAGGGDTPYATVDHRLKRNSRNLTKIGRETAETGNTGGLQDYRREFENDYCRELEKAIEGNSKVARQFYVLVTRKPMYGIETDNIYRQIFMGLHMRPRAEPNTDCWYIDCDKHEMELLWVLPTRPLMQSLYIAPPPGVDPFLAHCCKEYIDGRLNTEYDRIRAAGASAEVSGVQLAGDAGSSETPERREPTA